MAVYDWIGIAAWIASSALVLGVIRLVPDFRPSAKRPLKYWWVVFGFWLIATGFLFVAGTIVANAISRSIVRNRIVEAQGDSVPVYVDGREAADSAVALEELGKLRMIAAHHSHPLDMFEIRFGDTTLHIARDSERVHEYWVYWPPVSENSAIGRVRSLNLGRSLSAPDGSYEPGQEPPGKAGG